MDCVWNTSNVKHKERQWPDCKVICKVQIRVVCYGTHTPLTLGLYNLVHKAMGEQWGPLGLKLSVCVWEIRGAQLKGMSHTQSFREAVCRPLQVNDCPQGT